MDILVADDDCTGRFLVNSALRELGHSVTETANGCDAWEAWKRVHHQLVISDWIMPGIDGLEGANRETRSQYQTNSRKWPEALGADRPYPRDFKVPCK